MDLTTTPIVRFEILGLHGDRNLWLDFESPIKIMISENGTGKTTLLNTLFNVLSGKWLKLNQLQFKTIKIDFQNNKSITINYEDIRPENSDIFEEGIVRELLMYVPFEEVTQLIETGYHYPYNMFLRKFEHIIDMVGIPSRVIYDELRRINRTPHVLDDQIIARNKNLAKLTTILKEAFPYQLLYFPTYRRVEEDLRNLGIVEKDIDRDEQLIQFGMGDVRKRFDKITSRIKEFPLNGIRLLMGKCLHNLLVAFKETQFHTIVLKNLKLSG